MSDAPLDKSSILKRVRWQAVLIAFVVDYGGSTAFGVLAGVIAGVAHASQGGDPSDVQSAMFSSPQFMALLLAVGLIFVIIGGFVAGWLAPQARFLNAGAFAAVSVLLGLTHFSKFPDWYAWSGLLGTLPCALLGALLAGFFPNRDRLPPPLPGPR